MLTEDISHVQNLGSLQPVRREASLRSNPSCLSPHSGALASEVEEASGASLDLSVGTGNKHSWVQEGLNSRTHQAPCKMPPQFSQGRAEETRNTA